MSNLSSFTSAEVYDMAVQTEQSGRAFYEAAADAARTDTVRNLMTMLGQAEAQHEALFRSMKQKSAGLPPTESYDGERDDYINALLFSRVLPDPQSGLAAIAAMTSDLEALDFALRFEKDTILFMYEMREVVEAGEAIRIDALIVQEKSHVRTLGRMKAQISQ